MKKERLLTESQRSGVLDKLEAIHVNTKETLSKITSLFKALQQITTGVIPVHVIKQLELLEGMSKKMAMRAWALKEWFKTR